MLMQNSSTFFVWPIWLFIVDDMVCGRYGTYPQSQMSQLWL